MAMKGYSAFPKLQHCWNLTIRLFSVIFRTLVMGSQFILQPQLTGQYSFLEDTGKMRESWYFLFFQFSIFTFWSASSFLLLTRLDLFLIYNSQVVLRINSFFFFFYCGLFVLILVVFMLFLLSLRFGQISPLAFFRWFTATSDRNAESCNRIPSNYCLP